MKLTDKELLEAVKYAEKSDKKNSNFIELLKTTLTTEVKMSFGMFVGSTIIAILLTIFAGSIGLLMV